MPSVIDLLVVRFDLDRHVPLLAGGAGRQGLGIGGGGLSHDARADVDQQQQNEECTAAPADQVQNLFPFLLILFHHVLLFSATV